MNREEIKQEMEKLRTEWQLIMNNFDITGGEKGMKNNDKAYKRAKKIEKQLLILNKRLTH